MKNLVSIGTLSVAICVLLVVSLFSGCDGSEKRIELHQQSIDACIKQNGVPILLVSGRMGECVFNSKE